MWREHSSWQLLQPLHHRTACTVLIKYARVFVCRQQPANAAVSMALFLVTAGGRQCRARRWEFCRQQWKGVRVSVANRIDEITLSLPLVDATRCVVHPSQEQLLLVKAGWHGCHGVVAQMQQVISVAGSSVTALEADVDPANTFESN